MPHYHTNFLLSATSAAQFPPTTAPEIAFLGRSNVGKSSLINALLGESAARVSSTPGRTRAINFFALHLRAGIKPELILADLPGYGYAKISRSIRKEWPAFIDPYLATRRTLAACVCLVDMNIPPQPGDSILAEYLDSIGRPRIVVGTKADKLSGNQRVVSVNRLRKALGVDAILVCSAKDGRGIRELWSAIQKIVEEGKNRAV
ncbi:MAG TPA: ribosome biogenesis GTP-binding protein YihA/YsxC [Acidobacteriaceae bacterium]|nr:ribosome biogenesis GTP-binding protein YihA/YsxC [Acidobacteriaceae bacterium]